MNNKNNLCCDIKKDIRKSYATVSHLLNDKKNKIDICNGSTLDYITKTLHVTQREIENKKECCAINEEKKRLKEWEYILNPEKRKKEEEVEKRKHAYQMETDNKKRDEFKTKMKNVLNKSFIFEKGAEAERYINLIRYRYEYKEDEKFIMPDGTEIEEKLWIDRRKWIADEHQYYYNLNVMNILARLVTIAAFHKSNQKKETVNAKQSDAQRFEQQHGAGFLQNIPESFFTSGNIFPEQHQTTTQQNIPIPQSYIYPQPSFDMEKFKIDQTWEIKKTELKSILDTALQFDNPQNAEKHRSDYKNIFNAELQKYNQAILNYEREKQRKDEIRRGKQRITPINNANENNRPEKYTRIEERQQEFVPGPSKASVMGHSFQNKEEINIDVDQENNNDNNSSSSSSTAITNTDNIPTIPLTLPQSVVVSSEIQTDRPYFHVQSEGQLNKCVDSFYKQYEKKNKKKNNYWKN